MHESRGTSKHNHPRSSDVVFMWVLPKYCIREICLCLRPLCASLCCSWPWAAPFLFWALCGQNRPTTTEGSLLQSVSLGASVQKDTLLVSNYSVRRVDGVKLVDSLSLEDGRAVALAFCDLPQGWAEGMQGMQQGEHRRIWVPRMIAAGFSSAVVIDMDVVREHTFSE